MSLGRLLCAGKALIGFRDSGSAYRLPRKAPLPNFGGKGDPFASAKELQPQTGEEKADVHPTPHRGPQAISWLGQWFAPKQVGFFERKPHAARPNRVAKSTLPSPVQAELSLDNVKVVRNDLRSSDVDVVARGAVPSASLFGAAAAEKALDRLADRIVGVQPR